MPLPSSVCHSVLAGSRSVRKAITLTKHVMSPGFSAYRLNSDQLRMDPFLNVDHFYMSQPTFRPHPHAGFSAVTCLFDDSEGSFVNRDSFGDTSMIRPGDVHWTTAAAGIVHEEVPEKAGVMGHGLQIFANLDAESKLAKPKAEHLNAADIPVAHTAGGGRIKVIGGSSNGVSSPLQLYTPITLLEVTLPRGASFSHALPPSHNATVMVVGGEAKFGPEATAADFDGNGSAVAAVNDSSDVPTRIVLMAGKPLEQPIVWRGPFCGSSEAQVQGWMMAYQAGRMGSLEPSF